MIEKYGKFVALDGSEFPYGDFHSSRKEAAAKAETHDKAIIATREKQKGRPLTIRESLEPATPQETPPSEPIAAAGTKKETPAAETAESSCPIP